jgi:hypothetical protein
MATTLGTLVVVDQGACRLIDDLLHRGITTTLTFTAAQDVEGGTIGSIALTIPDSTTNNATWGALGNVANSLSRT